ncbi:uncharacterized protein [Miscanthus floridulus]|uniref:uncharacterized protein n=1 Tax=Miscanthus floridulus TaxID=154761 RepID=UPI003459907D
MGKKSWPFSALFDSLFSEFSPVPCLPATVTPHQQALGSGSIGLVYRDKLPYKCEVASKQAERSGIGGRRRCHFDAERALRGASDVTREPQPAATAGLLRQAHPGIRVYTIHGALRDHLHGSSRDGSSSCPSSTRTARPRGRDDM